MTAGAGPVLFPLPYDIGQCFFWVILAAVKLSAGMAAIA
jgi:hypothetical protein